MLLLLLKRLHPHFHLVLITLLNNQPKVDLCHHLRLFHVEYIFDSSRKYMNHIIDVHILKRFLPLETIDYFSNIVNTCFLKMPYFTLIWRWKNYFEIKTCKHYWSWQFWSKEGWTPDSTKVDAFNMISFVAWTIIIMLLLLLLLFCY